MKLPRFCAFSRCLLGVASVTALTFQASAAPFFWKSSSTSGDWATGANWSITNLASGTSPAAGPTSHATGTGDIVTFTVNSPANGAQTVNLQGGEKSALGLVTAAQTTTTSILSGGTPGSILNLGESGIDHNAGGLTIGSATAALAVDIRLTADQTWDSTSTGTGAAGLGIHGNVSSTAGEYRVLTLSGTNTSAFINGNITNGANSEFWVDKYGTGLWSLAGANNTFNGPLQVNEGTIRLTNRGTITPAKIFVGGEAAISLRAGGTGFTAPQIDEMRTAIDFSISSEFAIDTANGNFEYDRALNAGVKTTERIFHFRKLGGNTLTLSGNNSDFESTSIGDYKRKTIISEGTLALATPNARPGKIEVAPVGTLAAVVGGNGFTVSEIEALIDPGITTFQENGADKGSFGLSTANGDVVYSSVLAGSIRFNKSGANTLALTADNTFTGATVFSGGSLSVSRILNGGIASPLGASGSEAGNLIFAGGRLTYTGPAVAPNRLFSMNGNGAIEASGTGPLTFGAGTISHSGAAARTLTLSGINQDANTIASTLINSGTGGNTTAIFKTGYGNWTITGPNTATGFVRGRGGDVTFDYANTDPWAGNALIQSGKIILKAKSGVSTDTMPILQIGEAHNGLGQLKLTGNYGLTVTTLDGNGNSQRHNLIDLGTNGSITVGTLNTTSNTLRVNATTGLILNSAATDGPTGTGRANMVLRATDGTYGFTAFAPGSTNGVLQKLSGQDVLTPGGAVSINSATTNYYLGAGTYTTAGNANYSTMTFDSTAGAVNFSLPATNTLSPGGTGKAILASGANDISISGGNPTAAITQPIWLHNYLEPSATLNISSNLGTGSYFIIGGTGYTNYSGRGLGQKISPSDTQFVLNGGVFRMTLDQDLANAPGVLRVSEGIFEIGADLNGDTTPGDFTRASGTSFRLLGSAGFSAYTATPGGTRVANFNTPDPLVWGAADFLTNTVDNTDGDYAFRLSSPRSNATIEFSSKINLNGHLRVVEVADGSAATDAALSGILSGSVTSGLVKTGPGTLALTGANTYGGETRVLDGVLKIQANSIPSGSRLVIQGTGKVSVVGNVGVQSVVINGVEQGPGAVVSSSVLGNLYVGAAPAGMTYAQWVTNKSLQSAESGELFDADFDGLLNLLEYGLGTEPKTPNGSPLTHNAGNSVFRFNRATDRTDISTIIESSETMTGTWSTIATSVGTGSFVLQAGVTGVAIDESTPGTVIVTTSGTAPAKKFHRVRVTK